MDHYRGIELRHTLYTFHSCVLDVVAVFLLIADSTVHDTRGAFYEMGASSNDVDDEDVVTRVAFVIIDSFFFTGDDVTVAIHWESLR